MAKNDVRLPAVARLGRNHTMRNGSGAKSSIKRSNQFGLNS
jgi:hypothetical protein